jgi:hypothetical protein
VSSSRRRTLIVLAVAALAGVAAGVAIGLGDDDSEPAPGSEATAPAATSDPAESPAGEPPGNVSGEPKLPKPEEDPEGAAPGPSGPLPETSDEQAAASAARGYVQAIDRRSGGAVCRAFAPDVLDGFAFPVRRPTCPATVKASLGFEHRGFPVWEGSEMTDAISASVTGGAARVVATVFTVYADVREPTIEDDIIYLTRSGDRWLIAKPSLTLYRAVGDPDPPPSALAAP